MGLIFLGSHLPGVEPISDWEGVRSDAATYVQVCTGPASQQRLYTNRNATWTRRIVCIRLSYQSGSCSGLRIAKVGSF